jgi:hypothetical protein
MGPVLISSELHIDVNKVAKRFAHLPTAAPPQNVAYTSLCGHWRRGKSECPRWSVAPRPSAGSPPSPAARPLLR